MKKSVAAIASAIAISVAGAAYGDYPEKPISIVVPWPPGDLEDVLSRMIAEDLQETYGVAAAVVNKPGGGGGPFPGAIFVANAPADGYTIGSFVIAVPTIGHSIGIAELEPAKFDPLGIFLTYPFVLAASKDAPFSSMQELAKYARTNKVALGHFGAALAPTRTSFAYAKNAGFEWGSEAAFDMLDCNSLASGDADVVNTTLQLVLPCMDDIQFLASITDQRIPLIPDTPTLGELDESLNLALWNGLFVLKDTPEDAREKIIAVAKETVMSERAQKLAEDTGALVYWMDAEASEAQIEADIATLASIASILE
ncbi:MAG: tripartite tricarboxylate transporter substrate binding protein [Albidovulum sp.]|nr:tripartite tricarboxylate transporter substrate binding protein [Albidovulum sp.]